MLLPEASYEAACLSTRQHPYNGLLGAPAGAHCPHISHNSQTRCLFYFLFSLVFVFSFFSHIRRPAPMGVCVSRGWTSLTPPWGCGRHDALVESCGWMRHDALCMYYHEIYRDDGPRRALPCKSSTAHAGRVRARTSMTAYPPSKGAPNITAPRWRRLCGVLGYHTTQLLNYIYGQCDTGAVADDFLSR